MDMQRRTSLTASTRSSVVDLPPERVRRVVASGTSGPHWYVDALPFVVRGALDRVLGGAGRAHRPPGRPLLETGDRAGFWVVEGSTPSTLDLRAEVRAPGTVRLRTSWVPDHSGGTRVRQTVSFSPSGLLGATYLVSDVPARETVIELAHRRLLSELGG